MNFFLIGIDFKFLGIWYFGIIYYNWIIVIKLGLILLIKVYGRLYIELFVICFERKIYINLYEKVEVFFFFCCVFIC